MAKRKQPINVAIDTSLLVDLFVDDQKIFAERTDYALRSREYQIFIPTLVGVETLTTPAMRLKAQEPPIDNASTARARQLFRSPNIIWITLDRKSMMIAQELGLTRFIRPQDAAIVACAIRAECQFLFTKDDKLIKKAEGLEEITVCYPPDIPPLQNELSLEGNDDDK
ncbi:MAG: PIN domain-containing protein [Corynebacterium sp.]|nr:PIN domain-containing protein [Corynebacterium sp.]